mgnify:CR=1 FL=1
MSARPGFRHDQHDARIEQLRVPPHSIEAEQAVLGGLMLAPEAYDRINDKLNDSDFYRRDHQLIYRAISELAEKSRPYDAVTLGEWFESQGQIEQVAGGAYLVELASTTPSAANIRRYAEIVRERSIMRQLAEVGTEIARSAYNPQGRDAGQLLDEAENKVFQIAESTAKSKQGFLEMPALLKEVVERIDMLYSRDNLDEVTGVATGYDELDRITAGLQPAEMIILAARPSMGKTALAMNIVQHAAMIGKVPVAVFSLEMSVDSLALRMLCSLGPIDSQRIRTGRLIDSDWPKLTRATGMLSEAPIYIDDTPGLTVLEMRAKARRLKSEQDLGLIVVDYLQLMSGSSSDGENRATELGEISRGLKALAKELQCPVIALSQLNRSVETRTDKRPMMSDLRESGAIEQDADIIMFIYRDDYYNKDSREPGVAEIIIGKQRNGPTGTVKLAFVKPLTRFESLALGASDDF